MDNQQQQQQAARQRQQQAQQQAGQSYHLIAHKNRPFVNCGCGNFHFTKRGDFFCVHFIKKKRKAVRKSVC
ncbi:hypothetical protein [Fictibacillus enclensis]|uniref:hypothetical protein n=1 Tax=Fictibacillus enclensis TaxID=1017270 RepID=UPI0024C000AF|nr:hypothetical protein [Fictibacillus enclensis]WHY71223.1 hypothetical protein QNH15_19735 [Fictibacillus enclensis]